MIRRRDLIMAGLALIAAGTAEALRPRKKLILLRGGKIDALVPKAFGTWTAEGSNGLVSPDQAGKLAKSLYREIVERIYHDDKTGAAVMVLAAYGDTQSDLLQLHRPESCYPAVGYTIRSTRPKDLVLPGGARLPIREVIATAEGRVENIVYWTRIGEALPQSAGEQRKARFNDAIHGYVSDGILFRCSAIGDSEACFKVLEAFVPALLAATQRSGRPALIGDQIARQMTA
jgi:EpsI family protein